MEVIKNLLYEKIVQKYGSPLFIYDLSTITESYERLSAVLPNDSKLLYSVKCNNNSSIIKHLKSLNSGFEVATLEEYILLKNCGVNSNDIIFTSPSKTRKDIEYVINNGIRAISCESLDEYKIINTACLHLEMEVNVIIRLNISSKNSSSSLKMGGTASQFGIDYEFFLENLDRFKESKVRISGIHTFFGSNITNLKEIVENVRETIEVSNYIEEKLDKYLEILNFGGGFPAPFASNEKFVCLTSINGLIEQEFRKINNRTNKLLYFESGRYLLGEAGTLIGSILYQKKSKNKNYLIADVGMHCLNGLSSSLRIIRPKNEINFFREQNRIYRYTLVGPSCSPLDIIKQELLAEEKILEGELFYIENVGAYGLSAALNNFLSRSLPLEVSIINGMVVSVISTKVLKEKIG
ncbi:diaminopimelate decarboxylase [Enterococcus sp. DIV0212c]|uniref:hypothetical protein n=1 Tax=Enterococcus sp. DIV0212c TaxID=2230867 RepID=UPI001A9BD051|nr:hypothetical protein [Enterococcus sp. DIV0212c]MBO1354661.1 hypothetical protein [Enterococcus sp. DIV0212c]